MRIFAIFSLILAAVFALPALARPVERGPGSAPTPTSDASDISDASLAIGETSHHEGHAIASRTTPTADEDVLIHRTRELNLDGLFSRELLEEVLSRRAINGEGTSFHTLEKRRRKKKASPPPPKPTQSQNSQPSKPPKAKEVSKGISKGKKAVKVLSKVGKGFLDVFKHFRF